MKIKRHDTRKRMSQVVACGAFASCTVGMGLIAAVSSESSEPT